MRVVKQPFLPGARGYYGSASSFAVSTGTTSGSGSFTSGSLLYRAFTASLYFSRASSRVGEGVDAKIKLLAFAVHLVYKKERFFSSREYPKSKSLCLSYTVLFLGWFKT